MRIQLFLVSQETNLIHRSYLIFIIYLFLFGVKIKGLVFIIFLLFLKFSFVD